MAIKYGKEWEEEYERVLKERLESQPKPYKMGTPEWCKMFQETVDSDAEYREAAKTWEGAVTLVIGAKPEIGIEEDLYMVIDLWHGDCKSTKILPKEEAEKAPYVMRGSYETWKNVATGKTDAIKATMLGKIKLKGSLPTIVKHVKAAKRLAECSGLFEGVWLDELSKDELDKFKADIKQLRERFGV